MVVPARREPRFVYLSDAQRSQPTGGRFGWRLVAANNRPLGRGPVAEPSLELCRAAAEALHRHIQEIETTVVPDAVRGVWAWRVSRLGAPLALSIHPYLRRVECVRGLTQFLTSAAIAVPDDGVVRHFGPHSLRAYDADLSASGVIR